MIAAMTSVDHAPADPSAPRDPSGVAGRHGSTITVPVTTNGAAAIVTGAISDSTKCGAIRGGGGAGGGMTRSSNRWACDAALSPGCPSHGVRLSMPSSVEQTFVGAMASSSRLLGWPIAPDATYCSFDSGVRGFPASDLRGSPAVPTGPPVQAMPGGSSPSIVAASSICGSSQ